MGAGGLGGFRPLTGVIGGCGKLWWCKGLLGVGDLDRINIG